ncbi:MAG: vitamin B12 dependent-methionine synthase activation domain-containing protein [Halanaerobiaceae bacterium]
MVVLDDIPFEFDFSVFSKKIDLKTYENMEGEVLRFLDEIVDLVQPKAVYKEAFVDQKEGERVVVAGHTFYSKILRENLEKIERVFPYVATCGGELEDFQDDLSDPLQLFWVDQLKQMALSAASDWLNRELREKYRIEKIVSMNPGSADKEVWPLDQQQVLFSLLGEVEKAIGVHLTDSYLMVPNKSVSGIYFPRDESLINCEYCTRQDCPSRRAPHDPDKW